MPIDEKNERHGKKMRIFIFLSMVTLVTCETILTGASYFTDAVISMDIGFTAASMLVFENITFNGTFRIFDSSPGIKMSIKNCTFLYGLNISGLTPKTTDVVISNNTIYAGCIINATTFVNTHLDFSYNSIVSLHIMTGNFTNATISMVSNRMSFDITNSTFSRSNMTIDHNNILAVPSNDTNTFSQTTIGHNNILAMSCTNDTRTFSQTTLDHNNIFATSLTNGIYMTGSFNKSHIIMSNNFIFSDDVNYQPISLVGAISQSIFFITSNVMTVFTRQDYVSVSGTPIESNITIVCNKNGTIHQHHCFSETPTNTPSVTNGISRSLSFSSDMSLSTMFSPTILSQTYRTMSSSLDRSMTLTRNHYSTQTTVDTRTDERPTDERPIVERPTDEFPSKSKDVTTSISEGMARSVMALQIHPSSAAQSARMMSIVAMSSCNMTDADVSYVDYQVQLNIGSGEFSRMIGSVFIACMLIASCHLLTYVLYRQHRPVRLLPSVSSMIFTFYSTSIIRDTTRMTLYSVDTTEKALTYVCGSIIFSVMMNISYMILFRMNALIITYDRDGKIDTNETSISYDFVDKCQEIANSNNRPYVEMYGNYFATTNSIKHRKNYAYFVVEMWTTCIIAIVDGSRSTSGDCTERIWIMFVVAILYCGYHGVVRPLALEQLSTLIKSVVQLTMIILLIVRQKDIVEWMSMAMSVYFFVETIHSFVIDRKIDKQRRSWIQSYGSTAPLLVDTNDATCDNFGDDHNQPICNPLLAQTTHIV